MCCFPLKYWYTSPSPSSKPPSASPSPSQQGSITHPYLLCVCFLWLLAVEEASSPTSSTTTLNLTNEYLTAVQTNSYKEILEKIQHYHQSSSSSPSHLLTQLLKPNKSSIQEFLRQSKPTTLTRLVSTYLDRSEHTSHLFLLLYLSLDRARSLYAPLSPILQLNPFTPPQCRWIFDAFLEFDSLENPIIHPNFHEFRGSFFDLKLQLDKARNRPSLFCLPTAAASHHHKSQLDAAAKGTYALYNDLDTIDHLVARLHDAIESDKRLIRFGLDRGVDPYPMQEVVNQLKKNQPNFLKLFKDLEEHVCLCLAAINRVRSLLLQ